MIKLVVFDMAGTTVNNTHGVHDCLIKGFRKNGFKIDRGLANLSIAVPKPVGIRRILSELGIGDPTEILIEKILGDFKEEMMTFYRTDDSVKEMEGTLETFSELKKRGVKIGIETGFDRETAQVIIDRFGWEKDNWIDASCTSDEVENGRPAPDMIERLMELTGVESNDEIVKVGDTPADIQQGKNAGCHLVIAVNSGAFTLNQLKAEQPDAFVNDLNGLVGLIENLKEVKKYSLN